MNLELLIKIIPLVGCAMIIFVHAAYLSQRPHLQISRATGHKFFICSYLVFAFHYLHAVPAF